MRFSILIAIILVSTHICLAQNIQPTVGSPSSASMHSSPLFSDWDDHTRRLFSNQDDRIWQPPAAAWDVSFTPVDSLLREDDFWSNMLVSDADHDGFQEIVICHNPDGIGPSYIVFYEENGQGLFDAVFGAPVNGNLGLLAIGDVDDDGLTDLFIEHLSYRLESRYIRFESNTPQEFPKKKIWQGLKEGNVVNYRGFIADSDGDGSKEFIVSDIDLGFSTSRVKVFEATTGNQMSLILSAYVNGYPGNPVVADFDRDGRQEIAVAIGPSGGSIVLLESTGNNTYSKVFELFHPLSNAYQLALVDEKDSPDGVPRLFLPGHLSNGRYWLGVVESRSNNSLTAVNAISLHAVCAVSIPQIDVKDIVGDQVPELIIDRLGGPVPVYDMTAGGQLDLIDEPFVESSIEIVVTNKQAGFSGAIAIGTYPNHSNPDGKTIVLRSW